MSASITDKVKKKKTRQERNESIWGYIFITPAMIPFLMFIFVPIISAIVLSFTDYQLLAKPNFVGLKNYIKLFSDKRMWTSLGNSIKFTILSVVLSNVIGLALALLANRKMPKSISYIIRLCFFLPVIVAYSYCSLIWANWLSKDTGVINYYLGLIGISPVGWLTDKSLSLISIVLVDIWKTCGLAMLIYLAGLQNINPELYEAARVEGAHGWSLIRNITIPMLSPVILFNLIIFTINAVQIFDPISIMTNGGPGDSSRSIVLYIYDNFTQMKMGYSSAVSVILLIILMTISLLQFMIGEKKVEY